MKYPFWFVNSFYAVSDFIMALIPRSPPTFAQLKQAKVIGHRGVYHHSAIKENTMAAFEVALKAKVWAIEFDIRWTKDLVPVVHHDVTTKRVFGKNIIIKNITFAELRQAIPEIPTLQEVVDRFGKKICLLIELKQEHYTQLEQRIAALKVILQPLTPAKDFYIISLIPELLAQVNCFSKNCYFAIGMVAMKGISQLAIEQKYAGIMGHYMLTRLPLVQQQLAAKQVVCTGFVNSKNGLFRELKRGVTLVSCNNPGKIQAIIDYYLQKGEAHEH
ncbi:MAG: glycerophosphodiester phosphodiesterase [Gammaproteobacteria bacterium]|nr:glycerophosphodiester phosphodiesterase [Gammaproteobacteria bacterium]